MLVGVLRFIAGASGGPEVAMQMFTVPSRGSYPAQLAGHHTRPD